jgi:hypothetical protein
LTSADHIIGELDDFRAAGTPLPQWRKLIREHKSASTACSGTRHKVEEYRPTYGAVFQELRTGSPSDLNYYPDTVKYRGNSDPCRVSTLQGLVNTVVQDDVAKREATKKFYRKVAGLHRELDGSVALGEMRETLRMLRNPAKSLFDSARRDYLDALKKRKHRNPRNWARGLSGAWLEWIFGVQPLISDINGALGALDRLNADPIITRNITAVGRQRTSGATTQYLWNSGNNLRFRGSAVRTAKQKYKYRALYMRELSEIKNMTTAQRAAELFGLTADRFVPTVWELMPWSFLVDYFTNVGDILEQSFTSLQNVRWCHTTIVDSSIVTATSNLDKVATAAAMTGLYSRYLYSLPGPDARCVITKESWSRGAGGPSVDRLHFELPGSPQKWLNMAALGVQANSISPQRYSFRR